MARSSPTSIDGPAGKLELVQEVANPQGPLFDSGFCAVVCHPHPLYGGTMDNKVVTTLARAYRELGVPTVRFNFRGVGGSEGVHDNAAGEADDLQAVAEWLQAQLPDSRLLLAGFSFGTAVVAAGSSRLGAHHITLIAPPVERYSFAPQGHFACPALVILGDDDELVDLQSTRKWAEQLTSSVEILVVAGASHFFDGQLSALSNQLTPMLLEALL
ncbi:MAG: hypothetical protein DRR06_01870 [Gammaproteobacteria bacterium]|nr:MAG: hypothetical protein DRR06_01870 [Gammaproteobacteria bacterium]RLA50797.1 MAG: hypothetical protein DRR42_12140 [Gammaproteobacteria bacterium]